MMELGMILVIFENVMMMHFLIDFSKIGEKVRQRDMTTKYEVIIIMLAKILVLHLL